MPTLLGYWAGAATTLTLLALAGTALVEEKIAQGEEASRQRATIRRHGTEIRQRWLPMATTPFAST